MNIVKENKDELNIVLKLKVGKDDYEQRVETILKDYKKKVKLDGFRPGMVPNGLVKKMYGKHILLEELNKIVSESLSKYMLDEKMHVLGEPLPNKEEQSTIDLDTQSEFEFVFDIGLAPEFDVALNKKIKYPYYKIKVDEKMINDQIESHATRFSIMNPVEVANEKSMLKGDIAQIDADGNFVDGGITKDAVTISVNVIRDEGIKNIFLGSKVGNSLDFDVKKAFPNDTEISSMLNIKKEDVADIHGDFRFTINEISEFVSHPVNEELFTKVYGEGTVKNEEEFRTKITEEIEKFFVRESDFKFLIDAKDALIDKIDFKLPDAFLKRWLTETNEELNEERVENEYPLFVKDLKWQLIKDKIARDSEIKVEESEIIEVAKESILMQFQQYGLMNIPDEHLENYAKETLKKDKERRKFAEKKFEDKVIDHVKNSVALDVKEVTSEEFNKFFEDMKKEHEHVHDENCNHDHDH